MKILSTWQYDEQIDLWKCGSEMVHTDVIVGCFVDAEAKSGYSIEKLLRYVLKNGMNIYNLVEHSDLWKLNQIDDERLAIMEYDGGFSRVEAEVQWLNFHRHRG